MQISPLTLSQEDIKTIVYILHRGNQCEIRKERDNIIIVEIKRKALTRKPIIED